MEGAKCNDHYVHKGSAPNKDDKVFVVSLAYTGAQPRAVVVQALDAAIANAAVDGSGRPVDVASLTIFDFGKDTTVDVEIFLVILFGDLI